MKKTLGNIKYVSIRDVWPSESSDFTPWLAQPENLDKLSDKIGIPFGPATVEVPVGGYRADISTAENSTDARNVIIENQYGQTNHDHLGKIITYGSGKRANIVIWVAEKAGDEHRSAIQWLNEHTDEDVAFFLVTIKLIQIDNSNPAPIFEIIESPNDWERNIKYKSSMNDAQKERIGFWERFVEYASKNKRFTDVFRNRKISSKSYYLDLTFGDKRYHFYVANIAQPSKKGCSITAYMINQKPLYNQLKANAGNIENELGTKLKWKESENTCTIRWEMPKDLATSEQAIFDWYIDAAFKFKNALAKYDE